MAEQYDGCSGGMSWLWRKVLGKPPPWEGCCDAHDRAYAKGGDSFLRFKADADLMLCVTKRGHPYWAMVMFLAVRVGGHPWLPFPWRWGFAKRKPRDKG